MTVTPPAVGDEVYVWGNDVSSPQHLLSVFESKIMLLDRRSPGTGTPVWQLRRPDHWGNPEAFPVLSGNGEILAITMPNTGDLLLALPASQFKTMFPKAFAAPVETPVTPPPDKQPVPSP